MLRRHAQTLLVLSFAVVAVVVVGGAALIIRGDDTPPDGPPLDAAISGRVGSAVLAATITGSGPIDEPGPAPAEQPPEQADATSPDLTADTTPPPLTIAAPADGATVYTSVVEFEGTTEPGASVSSGPFLATTDTDGNWRIKLVVVPGANGTVFTALDADGNSTSVRTGVFYEPPAEATTSAPGTTTAPAPGTTTPPAPPTTTPPAPSNCPVGADADAAGSCSPRWPASAAGKRDVEEWRSLVGAYWPADRVDCVLGIIRRESLGNPQAHNLSSHTRGLMQHRPEYWNWRAVGAGFVDENGFTAHPYNAEANVAAGAYLATRSEAAGHPWWWPWKKRSGEEWVFPTTYGSCTGP